MKQWLAGWLTAVCLLVPFNPLSVQAAPTVFVQAVWVPYMEMDALYAAGDAAAVKETIRLRLQKAADEGFNTVYIHVRANSDAYYDSAVFSPTDRTQALLDKGVDPFGFFVQTGHELGLSVHAWINPYRIGVDRTRARADEVFEADGRFYYIPTSAAVRRLVVDGVRELVENYDIDGVQFDDYFYPAGAVAADVPAPFEATAFASVQATVGEWRRANVSALMTSVHAVCRVSGCEFGVSPSYDLLRNETDYYADVTRWAKTAGYVDYLCPQLYIGYKNETAPFERALADWSALERAESVALISGLARYKTGLYEDEYAGAGIAEWATGGDILARQIRAVKEAKWDGVALYGDDAPSDERDAEVVKREAGAVRAELLKNSHNSQ